MVSMDKNCMGTMPLPKLIVRFAVPALAGMLANALYNIVDRIFVGNTMGRDGLAAIGISFPCILLFVSAAMLIGAGAASRVSIMLGEGRREDAERTLGASFMLSCVSGVVFSLGAFVFYDDILLLMGASEHILEPAALYLRTIALGLPFPAVGFALSCEIRAAGSPAFAMGTQVLGAVANIVLDALFIIVLDMGIEGAAIATVLSQILSCAWTVYYFFSQSAKLRLRRRFVFAFDRTAISRMIAVGMPTCFVELNFAMINAIMTSTVSRYGGDIAVSAVGIYTSLDSLLFMPAIAIGEACQPVIGFNFGARRNDRVLKTAKMGIVITTAFYVVSFFVVMFGGEYLVMLFNRGDEELIKLSANAMRVSNLGLPVFGAVIIGTAFLQGLGLGRDAFIASFVRYALFLWLPLLTLPSILGIYGAWGSFAVSDFFGAAVTAFVALRVAKKLKEGRISPK